MAWDNTASVAAHKDVVALVGNNILDGDDKAAGSERWTDVTGTFTSTDLSLVTNPVFAAYDRLLGWDTRPSSGGTERNLMLRSDAVERFDTIVIGGHNFADAPSASANVKVQTADNDDMDDRSQTIHDFGNVTTADRLVKLLSASWVGVTRIRIEVTASSSFVPQIGEVWLGTRRVLPRNPSVPWDDRGERSSVVRTMTRSGIATIYKNYERQRFGVLALAHGTDSTRDLMRLFYTDSKGLTRPFVLIDKPNTVPGNAYVCTTPQPEMVQNLITANERNVQIVFEESSPFRGPE